MGIYDRDYFKLTSEEENEWGALKKIEHGEGFGGPVFFRIYPKAARHFQSLFPNNYLDIEDLKNEKELKELADDFLRLLNIIVGEREILNFIRERNAYFVVASILKKYYDFGHHDAYIFPEFMLGNSYKVDYLLVGKNSGGYEFVFVELESPNKKATKVDGELGQPYTKGIEQVDDWREWLEENYQSLYETFKKYGHPTKSLPYEFLKLDTTRLHYVVVAGRRGHFSENTYRKRRYKERNESIKLLHYDNLYDCALSVIGEATY